MSANFTFRYFPPDEEIYNAQEACSDFFICLFDADTDILTTFDLLPCFVKEYRAHNGLSDMERLSVIGEQDILTSIPNDPSKLNWNEIQWGPSAPFEPNIAGKWAEQWITLIQEADDDFLTSAFPYTLDIRTGRLTLRKECAIEDLQKLVAQANCAQQQGAYLTVEAIWG